MTADSLPVEHLFTLRPEADVMNATVIRRGPHGTMATPNVTGGTFEGARLRGRIVPPGGDWMTTRPHGTFLLEVRLTLVPDDGAAILMEYKGISTPERTGSKLRTAPLFETGDERYAWLNDIQAIGIGRNEGDDLSYEIYALR
jgi:hypothetical protein